ncbi:MAG TPA: acetate uptake transporter [Jatrophihabitans sp.]|jgi:succinate-acetate transporter protein|nr:acetate uptake transporter [Jatrophihabitans sp.]
MAQTTQTSPVPTRTAAVQSIADPAPLGLAAFAGTTFFLSVVNTNMLGASVQGTVLGLALFYGGLGQLLAGMWEFVKGNTFGALAFTSYGAFWMSFWYLVSHVVPTYESSQTPPAALDILHSVGLYLLMWGIFTTYMCVAASRVSGAVLGVFVLLALTFIVLAIGWFAESTTEFAANSNGWIHLGGWLGLVTALVAWYASFAGVTNFAFKRTVVPTFPRE